MLILTTSLFSTNGKSYTLFWKQRHFRVQGISGPYFTGKILTHSKAHACGGWLHQVRCFSLLHFMAIAKNIVKALVKQGKALHALLTAHSIWLFSPVFKGRQIIVITGIETSKRKISWMNADQKSVFSGYNPALVRKQHGCIRAVLALSKTCCFLRGVLAVIASYRHN